MNETTVYAIDQLAFELMWGISFLLVLIGLGLIGAVVLMFHAAWLMHLTFTGVRP